MISVVFGSRVNHRTGLHADLLKQIPNLLVDVLLQQNKTGNSMQINELQIYFKLLKVACLAIKADGLSHNTVLKPTGKSAEILAVVPNAGCLIKRQQPPDAQ